MPSDQPGMVMRKMMIALLERFGEKEARSDHARAPFCSIGWSAKPHRGSAMSQSTSKPRRSIGLSSAPAFPAS